MVDRNEIAAALRQIGRGFEALARAVAEDDVSATQDKRYLAALRQWGDQGLTRDQATTLLRKHGFAPQAVGGWARGNWIETRDDGLRYLTLRSHQWLARQADNDA